MSIERTFYCDCADCGASMLTASTSATPFLTVTQRAVLVPALLRLGLRSQTRGRKAAGRDHPLAPAK